MTDYYDISTWANNPKKFFEYIANQGKSDLKVEFIRPLKVDTAKLYALLKSKISQQPNGFYTFVQNGQPLDNIIWWDFALECDKGFIQVWRTNHIVEAIYHFDGGDFDVNKFLHTNITKYIDDVQKMIGTFDKHTVYTNHYKSYKDCVDYLWKEILKINLEPPASPETHVVEAHLHKHYFDNIQQFLNDSIKFHTLGKSLVLNAAFEIESFLNLVIRVGSTQELKKYPDVLKKHLNNSFGDKLKNLKFYSIIFSSDVDLENQAIKDAFELMTLRNKYVHFDENSSHNKISEILFDGDFPLQPTSKEAPAVESVKQIFHRPDFKMVKKSFDTALNFVTYIQSLFLPGYKDELILLLEQNPIGYNENRKMYSSVFNQMIGDFYLQFKKNNAGEKPAQSGASM
ncbi:MAG: hypothetical protein QM726_12415 [Chitinophagaceae bacterium]